MPLIVGLGNPGKEYDGTPHNVGFAVVARLAQRFGADFHRSRAGHGEEASLPLPVKTVVFRPLSYMNLSGGPVSTALRWYQFSPADLLVVCDDVNLPPGVLRIRSQGGAGGQKGLASIIETLGTEEFTRLRVGVGGGEPGADVASHVLARPEPELRGVLERAVDDAADAVECFLRDGLETAMNRFNPRPTPGDVNHPSGEDRSPDESSP